MKNTPFLGAGISKRYHQFVKRRYQQSPAIAGMQLIRLLARLPYFTCIEEGQKAYRAIEPVAAQGHQVLQFVLVVKSRFAPKAFSAVAAQRGRAANRCQLVKFRGTGNTSDFKELPTIINSEG